VFNLGFLMTQKISLSLQCTTTISLGQNDIQLFPRATLSLGHLGHGIGPLLEKDPQM